MSGERSPIGPVATGAVVQVEASDGSNRASSGALPRAVDPQRVDH